MERKYFLKSLLAGAVTAPALLAACGTDSVTPTSSVPRVSSSSTAATTTTGTSASGSTCTEAPTETEGPFPTHTPSSYVRADITDGKTGYKLTVKINVTNTKGSLPEGYSSKGAKTPTGVGQVTSADLSALAPLKELMAVDLSNNALVGLAGLNSPKLLPSLAVAFS